MLFVIKNMLLGTLYVISVAAIDQNIGQISRINTIK